MEVVIENNPLIRRLWNEWLEKDKELSLMTKEERGRCYHNYQWLYPKETKRNVDMEALYSSVHHRRNRDEFCRWFYVVGSYVLSRVHLGDCSYYQFKRIFKKQFNREKCTCDEFSQMVLMSLSMLGYITDFGFWYVYNEGGDNNHGYHYIVDEEKLMTWDHSFMMDKTETKSFDEKGEDANKISWTLHPDWLAERQYQSIKSVEVLKDGIKMSSKWLFGYDEYQYYYNLSGEKQYELMETWLSYQKLRDLSCGIVGGCKDDSDNLEGKGYAGRFYSPMTNMRSEHRLKYLRLDGELVSEVDVCNAQPTFLGIMMYKETGSMSEWLKQCLNGTFYEWIKEKTMTQDDRKTIKKWMMQYMYSCYQSDKKKDYEKPHRPTFENKKTEDPFLCFQQRLNSFLKRSEHAIYQKIDWYKRHPEYRADKTLYKCFEDEKGKRKKKKIGQGKWCSRLSYDLVRMEVEYIKRCIHALPVEMKFWTIHDCICVKESDSIKVKSIMEKVSKEMYGENVILRVKRENINEECS